MWERPQVTRPCGGGRREVPGAAAAQATFLEELAPSCVLHNGLGLTVWRRAREALLGWGGRRRADSKSFEMPNCQGAQASGKPL